MGRFLVLLPLLILCVGAGWLIGRSEVQRAVQQATAHLTDVLTAARVAAQIDWVGKPTDAAYAARELRLALDLYDEDQRKALG